MNFKTWHTKKDTFHLGLSDKEFKLRSIFKFCCSCHDGGQSVEMEAAFRGNYYGIRNGKGKLLLQEQFEVLEMWTEYNGYYIARDISKCHTWEKQGGQLLTVLPCTHLFSVFIIMQLFQLFRDVRIRVYSLILTLWQNVRYVKMKYKL